MMLGIEKCLIFLVTYGIKQIEVKASFISNV